MATKAKKKIFFTQTRLSELAARSGGMTRDDAIEGAMKSLESMRELSDVEIRKSIAAMSDIVRTPGSTLDDEGLLAIQGMADQIVTLAGTFGHAALDAAARSLCDIADGLLRTGRHDRQPIAVHVQTLQLMAPGVVTLSEEHCDRLLGELARVAAHFAFGSLGTVPVPDEIEAIAAAAK